MVLAIVKLQGFFGNVGSQGIHRIGKWGQGVFHVGFLQSGFSLDGVMKPQKFNSQKLSAWH